MGHQFSTGELQMKTISYHSENTFLNLTSHPPPVGDNFNEYLIYSLT